MANVVYELLYRCQNCQEEFLADPQIVLDSMYLATQLEKFSELVKSSFGQHLRPHACRKSAHRRETGIATAVAFVELNH